MPKSMIFRFSLYGFLKNQQYFEPFIMLVFLQMGLTFTLWGPSWLRDSSAMSLKFRQVLPIRSTQILLLLQLLYRGAITGTVLMGTPIYSFSALLLATARSRRLPIRPHKALILPRIEGRQTTNQGLQILRLCFMLLATYIYQIIIY